MPAHGQHYQTERGHGSLRELFLYAGSPLRFLSSLFGRRPTFCINRSGQVAKEQSVNKHDKTKQREQEGKSAKYSSMGIRKVIEVNRLSVRAPKVTFV